MRFCLLLACLVLAGCQSKPPDNEDALSRINSRYQLWTRSLILKIGRVGPNCYFLSSGQEVPLNLTPSDDTELTVAQRAGYLTVTPDGKDFWKVELTEKGRASLAQNEQVSHRSPYGHETGNGCDFYQVEFPIARATAIEITASRPDEQSCEYDFSWRWQPTELASVLQRDAEIFSRLTPQEKEQLSKEINAFGGSPPLPVPFPSSAESSLNKRTAVFTKHSDGWKFDYDRR
jgi:DNA-binding MarR family transcriptional regulator